jgi:hypothetical protein
MTGVLCLFCNEFDSTHRTPTYTDFICSRCIILLSSADQSELYRAYQKAKQMGSHRQAHAIEKFLIEGARHERKTKKSKRNLARKRPLRTVRPSRDQIR